LDELSKYVNYIAVVGLLSLASASGVKKEEVEVRLPMGKILSAMTTFIVVLVKKILFVTISHHCHQLHTYSG
jgi:hypothetical protein